MKKGYIILVLSAAGIFLIAGCEKVIEPKELPEQEPRVVVNCIIYNDSVIKANVSSSKSILSGKEYKYLENAVCHLYEDDQFIERLVGVTKGNYVSEKIAATNKKYTIKVEAPGYESAEGSSTLPGTVFLSRFQRSDSVNYTFRKYNFGPGGPGSIINIVGSVKYKIWISDDIHARNYYSVRALAVLRDSAGDQLDIDAEMYIIDHIKSASGFYQGLSVETDDLVLVNGRELMMDLEMYLSSLGSQDLSEVHSIEVMLVVSNISEELYKYKFTLNQQASTRASIFAEPVLVYNNIKNGMGIVGSANSNIISIHNSIIEKQ